MNDDRNPRPDLIGHATIPPELVPFLNETPQSEEEEEHPSDPRIDAEFARIEEAIGEDVQEIDPDLGVGNVSAYVGPVVVPDGAKGKAFTGKVKIAESKAGLRLGGRTARLKAQSGAEKAAEESPWASDAAAVVPAAALPSSHAPKGSAATAESASPEGGRSRGRAITVAIVALGIFVIVAVWIVAKGPREVVTTPMPAVSGTASGAPAVPSARLSGSAVVAAPTALPPIPLGTSEVDAGASLAPRAPSGPAPYKPKGGVVKGEDPYDAAVPMPAKTVEPVVPPPLPPTTVGPVVTVTPTASPPPSDSTAPRGLPYRKKDQ